MNQRFFELLFLLAVIFFFVNWQSNAATVAVHDPSIIVVYKDAAGNTFPQNDAGNTRTKYYYIFGTHLGAAYSTDMINWTPFTPSISLNGNISNNYYQIFKAEADYAGHYNSSDVRGNLWAPDIIYNTAMNKWCLYFSLSGHEFKSSIILLTADHIEGPYQKVGNVVHGGFTNNENSIGRSEYAKVTGSNTIDGRYLRNGTWNNDYGVSCIDPAVLYDEDGKLWLNYGSWSGGIFLVKLDEQTGLRDYDYNYGYGNNEVWDGSRLRYDPYMGVHLGGGYYVSGEGPYIEYIEDLDGNGFYYMFITMGFYSPEGGYTMRVFRSPTIDGVYTDVSGNDAVFPRYIFNYGNNTQYGFPIMQNYRYDWWDVGQTAQGHNSVLQDENGDSYLIYHTKQDNGTAFHNVEVHQLFHNENGWIVAAPFEYREGFGLGTNEYSTEDIAGLYGVITHNPVDYENLETNREQQLYVNADGTLSGAYTGTWSYNFSGGKQYLTLQTNAGTFQSVLCEQLMDGLSSYTLAFTGMNPANERALWGYKYTNTVTTNSTHYLGQELIVGQPDYSLVWDAYGDFHAETVSGDFEVEFTFENYTLAAENWHNWALALTTNGETWYLRADAWSNSTFSGSTVGYDYDWDWDTEYKEVFRDKEVRVKVSKTGTTINVFAYAENELVYTSSATNCPAGEYTVYLGGEATYMIVKKVSVGQQGVRQLVGIANEDGTYPAAFNSQQSPLTNVSGDFELKYTFRNYHNPVSNDNWDNYIIRAISGGQTMLIRADAFAMDAFGQVSYTYDWAWEDFISIMSGALVELNIKREGSTITYLATITSTEGATYSYQIVNSGAPTGEMSFGFTGEENMVDILSVETLSYEGEEVVTSTLGQDAEVNNLIIYSSNKTIYIKAEESGQTAIFSVHGRKVRSVSYSEGITTVKGLEPGVYIVGRRKVVVF